jgi:hypothetical protein
MASAAYWLSLAASPVFAMMSLLTGIHGDGMPYVWPLSGMMPMYLLMSAFHLTPWLRLFSLSASRQIVVARPPGVGRE